IQALTSLRKNSTAIQKGSYIQRWKNDDILVYERQDGSDTVTVALNRGPATTIVVNNLAIGDGSHLNLLNNETIAVNEGKATLHLNQNEAIVLHNSEGAEEPRLSTISFSCNQGYT
ncbi:alpha amylase C-terminal domain-containing protein, partial [Vibrio anguillarum]